MSDRLMSTGDVAEVLGVSEATVKRWADAGTLQCIRTPGKHRKFRLRDIALHLTSRGSARTEIIFPPEEQVTEIDELLGALLVGDTEKITGCIAAARLQRMTFAAIADRLVLPALLRVRQACQANKCEAYHWPLATQAMVEACVRQRSTLRPVGATRGRLLSVAAATDSSAVTAWIVALVAIESGFDSYVLGPGLAPLSVARAAEELGTSWVVCSADHADTVDSLAEYLRALLRGTERSQARVVVVGNLASAMVAVDDDVLAARNLQEVGDMLSPTALRVAR